MSVTEPDESAEAVTRLLVEARNGNAEALDRLLPLVYGELKRIAAGRLRLERPDHTLNTTALVHEAYVKLVDQRDVEWQSRAHFFAIASRAMRRILINYAEMRNAAKRGGGAAHVPVDHVEVMSPEQAEELLELDGAIERLKEFNQRGADVVIYRFYGGLTHEETTEALGVSIVTVRRAWTAARGWLRRELREQFPGPWSGPSLGGADP